MAINLTGQARRIGPNLTGWTSTTLAPKAPIAPPVPPVTPTRVIPRELIGGGRTSGGGSSGGAALGPNPRIATAPMTPLEQLLSQMFPDLVGSPQDRSGGPLSPDLRGMGAPEGPFNNIIANLGLGGGGGATMGGGWVPGPSIGGNGAAIASTIPGAPAWLGPQINSLPGGGGGYFAPPTMGGGGLDLAGLAALSAEQERQRATMLKAQSDAAAAWEAKLLADQRRQQQQDQINRLKLGGAAPSLGSWQSPTFKPSAWTPSLPLY